jgi:hypothetical protein
LCLSLGIHETGDVLGDCEHYGVECDGGKELVGWC